MRSRRGCTYANHAAENDEETYAGAGVPEQVHYYCHCLQPLLHHPKTLSNCWPMLGLLATTLDTSETLIRAVVRVRELLMGTVGLCTLLGQYEFYHFSSHFFCQNSIVTVRILLVFLQALPASLLTLRRLKRQILAILASLKIDSHHDALFLFKFHAFTRPGKLTHYPLSTFVYLLSSVSTRSSRLSPTIKWNHPYPPPSQLPRHF